MDVLVCAATAQGLDQNTWSKSSTKCDDNANDAISFHSAFANDGSHGMSRIHSDEVTMETPQVIDSSFYYIMNRMNLSRNVYHKWWFDCG